MEEESSVTISELSGMQVLSQISALIVSFVEVFKVFQNVFFPKNFFLKIGGKNMKNFTTF
jgi:hypothetical protein